MIDSKKEQIAECFKQHFNHYGYKKTSVDDIAKELNISKKTIYHYFSSKEKIFYYIISKIARQFRNNMDKNLEQFSTCQEKIKQLILMIFSETRKWLKQGNDAFEFKYKYEIARMAFQDAYGELIKKLIQQGIEKGEFPKANVDMNVRFIYGIISEAMNLVNSNPELKVEDEVINSISKLLQ
ncbi:TetR/AcrR family transcriptional regulator [bacterium]|nr:TetR/AcrR family transcriptional regulator [bacterium]